MAWDLTHAGDPSVRTGTQHILRSLSALCSRLCALDTHCWDRHYYCYSLGQSIYGIGLT